MTDRATNLDDALDRIAVSGRIDGAPQWVVDLHRGLSELDSAFASTHPLSSRPLGIGSAAIATATPYSIRRYFTEPVAPSRWSRRIAIAAILFVAIGLVLLARPHFMDSGGGRPHFAAVIPAATPDELAYVKVIVVIPTNCTLPALTRERYDAIIGAATPMSTNEFTALITAKTESLRQELQPTVSGGEITFAGGIEVSDEIAIEIANVLGDGLACSNAGLELNAAGIMSDDYVRTIPDPDQWFHDIERANGSPTTQIAQIRLTEFRRLQGGRIAVLALSLPAETESGPDVPTVTAATNGVVLVFVDTPAGWREDFAVSAVQLRPSASATPVS